MVRSSHHAHKLVIESDEEELRRFPIVHVLRDDMKGLPPPQSIEAVLRSLDRTKHVLSLVVPPGRPNTAGPILKIRAVEQRQSSAHTSKASTKANQPEAVKPKRQETSTLRFTWGISDNDFNHKTLKGQSLLSKGHIVVVTISKQKGRQARQPSAAEIQEWTTRVNKAMGLETSWVVMHKEPHWLLSKYILSYRGDVKKLEQAREKESSVQSHSGDSIS